MMKQRKIIICSVFILFLAVIPMASYTLVHFGSCQPGQPCVIPVWFAPLIYAPSGVLFAGLAFVLRDILQRLAGVGYSLLAVICGSFLSYFYVSPELAFASCSAYFLSEISDTVVYSALQKYNSILAIIISASVGLVIDSLVFLQIAFHSYQFISGQIIGKLWMVFLSIPFIHFSRRWLTPASNK